MHIAVISIGQTHVIECAPTWEAAFDFVKNHMPSDCTWHIAEVVSRGTNITTKQRGQQQ
jgi:hypothetical protein